jgi:hypothetical protein
MCRQSKEQVMQAVRLSRNGSTRWLTGIIVCFAVYCGAVSWPARAVAQEALRAAPYPVGMTRLEYIDPSDGGRPLNLMLIYRIS